MTDRLQHLLHDEARTFEVPPPPLDTILAGGRRRRRVRRTRAAVAVAASVLLVVGGAVGATRLAGDDPGRGAPDPAGTRTEHRTERPAPTGAPVQASGTGIEGQRFGANRADSVAAMTARLGEPDVVTEPERYVRIEGQEGWYEAPDDPISLSWRFPVVSVTCWGQICLIFGGESADDLRLRGWEAGEYRRWSSPGSAEEPDPTQLRLAGSGLALGDSWADLHAAYPGTSVAGGEGAALVVEDLPWPGISDGVGGWRLSGQWDFARPERVPPGAVVTRLSGGEGPEPGCC